MNLSIGATALHDSFATMLTKAFIVAITFQLFLHLKDAYEFGTEPLEPKFLVGFSQAVLLACAILFIADLIIPSFISGPQSLALTLFSISLVLATWHLLLRVYFNIRHRRS